MIDRKANRTVTAALAAAALLLAAVGAANAAHVIRSPTAGVSTAQPGHASPNYGYGRGWCYWHPYACHRY
jgi:carbohydrate-selective porin OprB